MKVIPIIGNDDSFLYRFLVSSRFRVARHTTVVVALFVIACNLVLFSCQGYIEMLGKWIYLLIFNMFLLYGGIFYFNLLFFYSTFCLFFITFLTVFRSYFRIRSFFMRIFHNKIVFISIHLYDSKKNS